MYGLFGCAKTGEVVDPPPNGVPIDPGGPLLPLPPWLKPGLPPPGPRPEITDSKYLR